jgi:hypothetical protein
MEMLMGVQTTFVEFVKFKVSVVWSSVKSGLPVAVGLMGEKMVKWELQNSLVRFIKGICE